MEEKDSPVGWLCPRCKKVNSPFVDQCSCEPEENKDTININWYPEPYNLNLIYTSQPIQPAIAPYQPPVTVPNTGSQPEQPWSPIKIWCVDPGFDTLVDGSPIVYWQVEKTYEVFDKDRFFNPYKGKIW